MQDRIPRYAGRVLMTPVSGQPNTYDMVRADEPIQEGTKLNKALFDYALAANGVTEGNGKEYSLINGAEGFTLTDGAKINFCLHVASEINPTLNINNQGAKPILSAPNVPLKIGTEAGVWITAVYSATFDAFIVLGSASGISKVVDLYVGAWDDNNNQTVYVSGVTVNNFTITKIVSDYGDTYIWDDVKCVEQGNGHMVFHCDKIPKTDLKAQIFTISSNDSVLMDVTPKLPKVITGSYVGDGTGSVLVELDNLEKGQNDNHQDVDWVEVSNAPRNIDFPFALAGIIITKEGDTDSDIMAVNSTKLIELTEDGWDAYGYNRYGNLGETLYIGFKSKPTYAQCKVDGDAIKLYSNIQIKINSLDLRQAFYNAGYNDFYYGKMELSTPYGKGSVSMDSVNKPYEDFIMTAETPMLNTLNDAGVTYHYIAWGV